MSIQSYLSYLSKINLTEKQLKTEIEESLSRASQHENIINEKQFNEIWSSTLAKKFLEQKDCEIQILNILLSYVNESVELNDIQKDEKYVLARGAADEEFARQLEPDLKSQPVPEQTEDVKVVVGKNFNEIVNDKLKDVLIYFYAPYNGRCISFAREYDELAKKLKEESDIVIAKMDGARVVDELIEYLAKEATEPLNGYDRDGLNNDEHSTDDEL